MAIQHYENFPVASILLPARLRSAVVAIYNFARSADDWADENHFSDAERLAHLQAFDQALNAIENHQSFEHCLFNSAERTLFQHLQTAIEQHHLPIFALKNLLRAFTQDVTKKRYATFEELEHYAQFSAVPVGVLMLHLFHCATPKNLDYSYKICTALQFINICQDIALDLQKNRIYLPQQEMEEFGITEADLFAHRLSPAFVQLMQKQIARARKIMREGAPLVFQLPLRFAWEIRLTILGALLILEKIEAHQFDIFNQRPQINKKDAFILVQRVFFQKNFRPSVEK